MPHIWHWGGFSTEVQHGWSWERGPGSVHIPAVPLSQIIPVLLELGKQEGKGGPCSSVLPRGHCPSLNWGAPATPALGSFLIILSDHPSIRNLRQRIPGTQRCEPGECPWHIPLNQTGFKAHTSQGSEQRSFCGLIKPTSKNIPMDVLKGDKHLKREKTIDPTGLKCFFVPLILLRDAGRKMFCFNEQSCADIPIS